jgi:hypothetical protein
MCMKTRIKPVYQGVQGAFPWQAVTSAGGTGLKLVLMNQECVSTMPDLHNHNLGLKGWEMVLRGEIRQKKLVWVG